MNEKVIYGIVIALVVAGAVGGWMMWTPANNANFPEGTPWMCQNPSCKTEFHLTMKQLSEHYKANYGEQPKCPKCSQPALRAERCDHCGKLFPQQRGVNVCPHCGKEKVAQPA